MAKNRIMADFKMLGKKFKFWPNLLFSVIFYGHGKGSEKKNKTACQWLAVKMC